MPRVRVAALLGEALAELRVDPDDVHDLVGLGRSPPSSPVALRLFPKWQSPVFFIYSLLARILH